MNVRAIPKKIKILKNLIYLKHITVFNHLLREGSIRKLIMQSAYTIL